MDLLMGQLLLLSPIYTAWRLLLHAYAVFANRGTGKYTEQYPVRTLLQGVIKAYGSAIAGLPKMWKKRKEMQKTRKVRYMAISNWLKTYQISAVELALKE